MNWPIMPVIGLLTKGFEAWGLGCGGWPIIWPNKVPRPLFMAPFNNPPISMLATTGSICLMT